MKFDLFPEHTEAFIRKSHRLLFWGHKRARELNLLDANSKEELISQRIVEKINYLIENELSDEYWHYKARDEQKVSINGKSDKNRREIDIGIDTSEFKIERFKPELVCEAKRLRKNGYSIGEYVGGKGMPFFIQEEYATNYNFAAMIGYIQSDDISYWFPQLQFSFDSVKYIENLKILQPLIACTVINEFAQEWTSIHERPTLGPIKIYHIFLDCC